jgi:hypothetical protein
MTVQKAVPTKAVPTIPEVNFPMLTINRYGLMNLTTRELLKYFAYHGTIVPDFQRPEVWDGSDEKAGLLTIKNGQPFPTLIIGTCLDTFGAVCGSFVIDGQQRTKMIRDLLKKFASLPLTIEVIMNYVWSVQVVRGTAEQLQELYVRVNSKSGLSPCQKIEGTFKGHVKEIKNAFKNSTEIKTLFTRTTRVAFEELAKTAEDKPDYMEVLVSGKVSDISVFLTVAEISQFQATTKSLEVVKFVSGITSVNEMPKHFESITRKLAILYSVMSDELISKAVKNNLAYPVAVYCLANKYSAVEILSGLRSMFQADGTRKAISQTINLIDITGAKVGTTTADDEMLFGKGSDNAREATCRKVTFIENLIKQAKLDAMEVGSIELDEAEEKALNKSVRG